MSVENLRAGVADLNEALQKRRDRKAAQKKAQQEAEARQALAQAFGGTLQGKTTQGKLAGQALASGLIEPKEALDKVSLWDNPDKAIFFLQNSILSETDPVKRKQLQAGLNETMKFYQTLKQSEAYWKAYKTMNGQLKAKSEFGVLHSRSGGGKENAETTLPTNMTNYTLPLGQDFAMGLIKHLESDPKTKDTFNLFENQRTGTASQDITPEQRIALRESVISYSKDRIKKIDPRLDAPGMEGYLGDLAGMAAQNYEINGLPAFTRVGSSKGTLRNESLNLSVPVPKDIFFRKPPEAKQQEKILPEKQPQGSSVIQTKGVTPFSAPAQKPEKPTNYDANYYLGE